jgi:type II secretory pathway pseudopilin PulG
MAPGDVPEQSPKNWRLRRLTTLAFVTVVVFLLLVILFPVSTGRTRAREAQARLEAALIINATLAYRANYNRLPGSAQAFSSGSPDFTFGTHGLDLPISIPPMTNSYRANNSELLAILMDLTSFRNGQPTVNVGHVCNPAKLAFLDGKQVNGPLPGIDEHGVYRDPWANPYIITLDVNGDGFCEDPLYGKVADKVFVWSFGPDGKADLNLKPDEGVNADNLSSGGKTNSP